MKKLIGLIGILLISTLIALSVFKSEGKDTVTFSLQNEPTPAQSVVQEKITSPNRLRIPKINVDAEVEYVGLDEKNNMDVPKNEANVAWYQLGFLPGQPGNSVIAGHLDGRNGQPAVFWNISQLTTGDEIIVVDQNGSELTFAVTGSNVYPFDQFPIEEVFGKSNTARLNLITCDGVFDKQSKNYSLRRVVYSTLKKT